MALTAMLIGLNLLLVESVPLAVPFLQAHEPMPIPSASKKPIP
jgi:hypothetical protein